MSLQLSILKWKLISEKERQSPSAFDCASDFDQDPDAYLGLKLSHKVELGF